MSKNIIQRIISGFFIAIIFSISIFLYRNLFYLLLVFIAFSMVYEWNKMISQKNNFNWPMMQGIAIIFPGIVAVSYISMADASGFILALYFIIVWCVDIFAMFGGKYFGGLKLAPTISPSKTYSGLICGVLASAVISYSIFRYAIPESQNPIAVAINIEQNGWVIILGLCFLGILAQAGDLFISIFKRKYGIKDSGSIIPGHGGMLDRFDGITFSAPIFAFVLYYLLKL